MVDLKLARKGDVLFWRKGNFETIRNIKVTSVLKYPIFITFQDITIGMTYTRFGCYWSLKTARPEDIIMMRILFIEFNLEGWQSG